MIADYISKLVPDGGFRKGELVVIGSNRRAGMSMFTTEGLESLMKMPMIQSGDFMDDGRCMKMTVLKARKPVNAVEITVRQHKRRRNQTEAYHRKVQKRWDKRSKKETKFQVVSKPLVFNMSHDLHDAIGFAFASLASERKVPNAKVSKHG